MPTLRMVKRVTVIISDLNFYLLWKYHENCKNIHKRYVRVASYYRFSIALMGIDSTRRDTLRGILYECEDDKKKNTVMIILR